MATVGTHHPLYRSPRHSAPCPQCRHLAGTQTLLTSTVSYFLCEHCGHRWQMAREPDSPECHNAMDSLKPAACPSCGSQAVGTLAKIVTSDTMWRCHRCGNSWQVQKGRRVQSGQ